ncbi:MAG: TetR/AcrR family transcriptional regulator [Proteobacteria bacterium]|nr:TetR/AcrR family transcriptional regulator [Pseudomonadota bacterium]
MAQAKKSAAAGARTGKAPAPAPAPVRRDPERTRARILEAARIEFAQRGLGGARVDQITARAGSNKRMIYYYFGNKEALFLAALESAYEHIRKAEQSLKLTDLDPVEGMRRMVRFTWEYYLAHPEFITLLNSENLHRARHLKRSKEIQALHSPLVAMLEDLLARGQRSGVFRRGVDAVQLYISIAALGYFYLSNNHTLSTIFGRDLMRPQALQQRLTHMTDLVLVYLSK